MRGLTGPELPFLSRAGPSHVLGDIHQKIFLKQDWENIHIRQKRERKGLPHLPTTFGNLQPKRWHKLVQDVIHAARSARPQPPCAARWWGHQVLSAGRRPREAEGTLSPSRSLAASPSYEIFGCVKREGGVPWFRWYNVRPLSTIWIPGGRGAPLQVHPIQGTRPDVVDTLAGAAAAAGDPTAGGRARAH